MYSERCTLDPFVQHLALIVAMDYSMFQETSGPGLQLSKKRFHTAKREDESIYESKSNTKNDQETIL